MKKNLKIVRLDTKYCNYLRKFETRVPYNYGKKELRPFIGVLFKVNNLLYFAPLSSPKLKHLKMKSKIDFLKLDNGKLGAINFNNMLPVTENNIIKVDLDKKCLTKSEENYLKLLKEQLRWLNRHSKQLYDMSKNLYNKYLEGKLTFNISNRCCNFPLLEEKCQEFNNITSKV